MPSKSVLKKTTTMLTATMQRKVRSMAKRDNVAQWKIIDAALRVYFGTKDVE